MGKETKVLQWEDCKEELERLVAQRNEEYNKSFEQARLQSAKIMFDQFLKTNPKGEKETDKEYEERAKHYVQDFIDQAPDEFQRNLRTYCYTMGTIFNQLARLENSFADFKEVYMAVNEVNIQDYQVRHAEELAKMRKEMEEAQKKAQREQQVKANKDALVKKISKK